MAEDRKPRGWGKFDELTRKLVKVPKDAVDKATKKKKKGRK